MDPSQVDSITLIIDAVQTGGLVTALTLGIIAFARGWVYPASIVEELRQHIKELTAALTAANAGMERMADAWEARNAVERDREWERRTFSERTAVKRSRYVDRDNEEHT